MVLLQNLLNALDIMEQNLRHTVKNMSFTVERAIESSSPYKFSLFRGFHSESPFSILTSLYLPL